MTDIIHDGAPAGASRTYWRSLEQLEGSPEFEEILRREFPEGVADRPVLTDPVSRRRFLGVVAASVAMAGLTSCRKPGRKILPFAERPEGLVPGVAEWYASTYDRGGYGIGILARSNEGRPTKIEGNPGHPASRGGADAWAQAEILNLYDPARSADVLKNGSVENNSGAHDHEHGEGDDHTGHEHWTLDDFFAEWKPLKDGFVKAGKGLCFLVPPTTSPTFARLVAEVRSAFADASFHTWSPLHRDEELRGTETAFAQSLDVQYDLSQARVVAAFDSDFLGCDGHTLGPVRDWADARKVRSPADEPPRLYVAEATYTLTGSNADHRFRLSSAQVGDAVCALAKALGVGGDDPALKASLDAYSTTGFQSASGAEWIRAVADDLRSAAGRCCVIVGTRQPAAIQAVGHAINASLGNVGAGKPVAYLPTPERVTDEAAVASLRSLVAKLNQPGSVEALICLGVNPVYDAPADLDFAAAYERVPWTVHLGEWVDETAAISTWHLPMAHPLETWGDLRSWDGTASIVQPLIDPLFGGVTPIELLAHLAETDDTGGHELVRATWRESDRPAGVDFDAFWDTCLQTGVVPGEAAPQPIAPAPVAGRIASALERRGGPAGAPSTAAVEVNFRPDPTVLAGRYSNNPWLQELPTPIEKLTWDNAVLMSRSTAEELGVYNGDVVKLTLSDRSVEGPVWIQPGHADYSVTVTFGYGRRMDAACGIANGDEHESRGFDAFLLRGSDDGWIGRGLKIEKTGRTHQLVSAQDHGSMEDRPLVREASLSEYRANPRFAPDETPTAQTAKLKGVPESEIVRSLWTERDYSQGPQWGMVIDLSSCTGCSACVVACVAENNIPMVGKAEVAVGREMFWNRLDRYFSGGATQDGVATDAEPQVVHQMVPCMQCENAPCESVCPVNATTHTPDGLNDMVYNRCIGTRYCNNNCPYKVRRFNWFNFNLDVEPTRQLAFNPDVTVRARGVMEKCTYCVQRINGGKLQAKLDGRALADGDIRTACQQSCPADAIAFGDIRDANSRVAQWKANDLEYAMLGELNVKPRTTYLGKVRNPNPALEGQS